MRDNRLSECARLIWPAAWGGLALTRSAWALPLSIVVPAACRPIGATTVLLVRHAEKVSDERDAVLSETGEERAR